MPAVSLVVLLSSLFLRSLLAADFPQASISNGLIHAKLYLPDSKQGYYRATRFDWSGVIASLEYQGHQYFGPWFERYDPLTHDAITGPVEEFRSQNSALGYDEAKVGGTFIRIGIGALRKPEEAQFRRFNTYEIVDPGKWTVRKKSERIEFVHELIHSSGYAYVYRKTVRLAKGKPELLLEHRLKNTGKRVIETQVYNHNFFVIDGQPSGPDFTVHFPFEPKAVDDFKKSAEIRASSSSTCGNWPRGEFVFSPAGLWKSAQDYDIRIENRKTGAGVRIQGDRPLSDLLFWSVRTTLCPEPYITLKVDPGQESSWVITYTFYTVPKPEK